MNREKMAFIVIIILIAFIALGKNIGISDSISVIDLVLSSIIAVLIFNYDDVDQKKANFFVQMEKRIDLAFFKNEQAGDFYKQVLKNCLYDGLILKDKYLNRRVNEYYYYKVYRMNKDLDESKDSGTSNGFYWISNENEKYSLDTKKFKNTSKNIYQDFRVMLSLYRDIVNNFEQLSDKVQKEIISNKDDYLSFRNKLEKERILEKDGKTYRLGELVKFAMDESIGEILNEDKGKIILVHDDKVNNFNNKNTFEKFKNHAYVIKKVLEITKEEK